MSQDPADPPSPEGEQPDPSQESAGQESAGQESANPGPAPGSSGSDPAAELGQTMVYPVVAPAKPQPVPQEFLDIHVEVVGGPMDGLWARAREAHFTIGRSRRSNLVLPLDPMVSTDHAILVREGQAFWLEDLDSRNGTFLGDQQVEGRTLIGPGTTFTVGQTQIEFQPR